MRRLLNDICRCHDNECPQRSDCLRYLQRNEGGERTPNALTLRALTPEKRTMS